MADIVYPNLGSGGDYTPPGTPDLIELLGRVQECIRTIDSVNKSLGGKLRNSAKKGIGTVNAVMTNVIGQTATPISQASTAIQTVQQQIQSAIDGSASSALTMAAVAVNPSVQTSQPSGIGCDVENPAPYVDWCSEDGDEVPYTACGGYGNFTCPLGSNPVYHDTQVGQFTECVRVVTRPKDFNKAINCATGRYLPSTQSVTQPTDSGDSNLNPVNVPSSPPVANGGTNQGSSPPPVVVQNPSQSPDGGQCCQPPQVTVNPQCPNVTVNPPQVSVYPQITINTPSGTVYQGTPPPPQQITIPVVPPPKPYCPPPPPPCKTPTIYYGFCDPNTGEVCVDTTFFCALFTNGYFVTSGVDEDEVRAETEAWCKDNSNNPDKKKQYPPPISLGGIGGGTSIFTCNLADFYKQEQAKVFFSDTLTQELWASAKSTVDGVGDSLFASICGDDPVGCSIMTAAKGTFKSSLYTCELILPKLVEHLGCLDPTFLNVAKQLSILNFWQAQSGLDLTEFRRIFDYTMNYHCRQKHLEPNEAMAAFLADVIDTQALDTYWGIHGLCNDDLKQAIMTQRAKPVPIELAVMRRRGVIDDERYSKAMRQLGYLEPQVSEQLFDLTEQRPGPAELIRFMVRDADDADIVTGLGLDDLFEHKFGPKLQQWATDQGITREQMVYNWRSHWQIPGPSQLFEFWQRLRRNPQFGTPEEQRAKIEKALIHNDILPTWFDSYFAVQYLPLSRIDLRRMYAVGTIDDKELDNGYAAIGYSDENAEKLVKFTHKLKLQQAAKLPVVRQWQQFAITRDSVESKLKDYKLTKDEIDGILGPAEVAFEHSDYGKAFTAGTIDAATLRDKLSSQGVSDDGITGIIDRLSLLVKDNDAISDYELGTSTRDNAKQVMSVAGISDERATYLLDKVDNRINRELTKACIAGLRRQYLTGAFDKQHAVNKLIGQGIVLERANAITDSWDCVGQSRGKQVGASQLCNWYSDGMIDGQEFIKRLRNIGYDNDTALIIVSSCQAKIDKAQQKQALADQKRQQQAQEKAQQQAGKALAQLAKEQAQLVKASEAAKKARKNREAQLISIAAKLETKSTGTLSEVIATVQETNATLKQQYYLGVDEALELMLSTTDKWNGGDLNVWVDKVQANAQLLIATQLPADTSELVNVAASNGVQKPSVS